MIKTPVFPNVPVLVFDGSAYMRQVVRAMLEAAGMRDVHEAGDVAQAITFLTRVKPGLIIVDWQPHTGPLLELLRDPERSRQTSVPVIVTAWAPTQSVVDTAARNRVDCVLRKPFAPKALWQRVEHFFGLDLPPAPPGLFAVAPMAAEGGATADAFAIDA